MVGAGGASGGGGVSWKLKKAAKKILARTCGGSFSWTTSSADSSSSASRHSYLHTHDVFQVQNDPTTTTSSNSHNANAAAIHMNVCAICLDPLDYSSGGNPYPAIFTAQCSHAFHFSCISSNVCHGSVTCPIYRAHWTQLPRNLNSRCSLLSSQSDPILQILDDSIASFRVHMRSFILFAHYDDDDPVEPDHASHHLRLHISLVPLHITLPSIHLFPRLKSGVKIMSPSVTDRKNHPSQLQIIFLPLNRTLSLVPLLSEHVFV